MINNITVVESDEELIKNLLNYISRTRELMKKISQYNNSKLEKEEIQLEYKRLKTIFLEQEHFWSLSKNRNSATEFSKQIYIPAIREAIAYGFTVPINSLINRKMYNAVEEGNYKLRKYISYEELKRLIEEKSIDLE